MFPQTPTNDFRKFLSNIVEAFEGLLRPSWVDELEARMGAVEDALARVEENLSGLTDEIAQVVQVIQNLTSQVNDPAIATELGSVADRLQAAKDTLEGATTLDDPAPEPPVAEPPADPGTGDQPADPGGVPSDPAPVDPGTPPDSIPPDATPPATPDDVPPADVPPTDPAVPAEEPPVQGSDPGDTDQPA